MDFPILSSLILLPSIGAIFIFFSKSKDKNNISSKYISLFISLVNFILSIYLWFSFDNTFMNFNLLKREMAYRIC